MTEIIVQQVSNRSAFLSVRLGRRSRGPLIGESYAHVLATEALEGC